MILKIVLAISIILTTIHLISLFVQGIRTRNKADKIKRIRGTERHKMKYVWEKNSAVYHTKMNDLSYSTKCDQSTFYMTGSDTRPKDKRLCKSCGKAGR